jgi:hypothetical protein
MANTYFVSTDFTLREGQAVTLTSFLGPVVLPSGDPLENRRCLQLSVMEDRQPLNVRASVLLTQREVIQLATALLDFLEISLAKELAQEYDKYNITS